MAKKLETILLVVAVVLSLATHAAGLSQVTITVEGMVCPACPRAVKAALERLPGVAEVDVNFQKKEAVVEYDPQRISPERMVEVINTLGFRATLPAGQHERR
jgi:mercuric ion binding protein